MSGWRLPVAFVLVAAAASMATLFALQRTSEPAPAIAEAALVPHAPQLDAAQIASGRLTMERMPEEVGKALETYSDEIVKTAQAIETKQARVSGTCAPGSAIRIIAEDGSVRCQQLPRGVVSVPALTAVARLSETRTEAGSVKGGSGRFQSAGEDDYLVAPIALPDGAIVTGLSYVFYDAAEDSDSEAFLYRSDDVPLASVASSGAAEQVRVASTDRVQLHRVDASRYTYFVYFQVSSRAGARLMPISASVTYRLP